MQCRNTIRRFALVLMFAASLSGCGSKGTAPEVTFEKGNLLQARGQFEDAITLYTEAEKKLKDLPDLYFSRGLCYERLQLHEKALEDYDRCLKLEPRHLDAINNKGVVLASADRFEEAARQFTALLELMPENVLALRNRGLCYHDQNEFELALTDYDQAIQLAPKDGETWFQRGNLLLEQGKLAESEADYSQAIELNKDHAKAWMNRGVARYQRGELEQAMIDLKQAREIDDNIVIPGLNWIQAGTVTEVVAAKPVIEVAPGLWGAAVPWLISRLEADGLTDVQIQSEAAVEQCARLTAIHDDQTVVIYASLAESTTQDIRLIAPKDDDSDRWLLIVAPAAESEESVEPFIIRQRDKKWVPEDEKLTPFISTLSLN